ncbi:MAG: Asp-tRNA(Asn)/Glu-tRNA(Gln) amidotransferase subunit GatB [Candidatus Hydrothermales bacterium]
MSEFDVKIGVEIHVQLKTKSKMFCSCKVDLKSEPNRNICPICTGQPGTLPTPNEKAVEYAVIVSRALNSKIPDFLYFSRKNYFYPDLPKGYQITQYGISTGYNGSVPVIKDKEVIYFPIERVNLEEETAKSIYVDGKVFLDYNRCGIPLLEIVTPPVFDFPDILISFLKSLRRTLIYLGVSDCNMEEGEFRVDTNISVNLKGATLDSRVEIKNLNSFSAIKESLEYEIRRQKEAILNNAVVTRETRLWDEVKKETRAMRKKEFVEDYRYFPEPDLPPFEVKKEWLTKELPLLPDYYFRELIKKGADSKEAEIIISSPFLADFTLKVLEKFSFQKVKGWILTEILQYVDDLESLRELPFSFTDFILFLENLEKGLIPRHIGQEIIRISMTEKVNISDLIKDKVEIKSASEVDKVVEEVIRENASVVEKIRAGKVSAISFLIGQTMSKLKGKANPKEVKEIIEKKLNIK